MAKFQPAVERILQKKICYRCNSRNPMKADRCRKCGYKNLRDKAQESRGT